MSFYKQFTPRPVQVLERLGDRLVLTDDGALKADDRIVVQGIYQVRMSKPLPVTEGGLPVK